jgi:hypothetical protein
VNEQQEAVSFARGCLWAVVPGVLFWLAAVGTVTCAVAGCWE